MNTKPLGFFGERAAAFYLQLRGYRIRERNFRCSYGEIDLIAERGNQLVFVEVKTRRSDEYGTPAEAVGYRKQKKITTVAQYYLLAYPEDKEIRFDVVEVCVRSTGRGGFRVKKINHLPDAF